MTTMFGIHGSCVTRDTFAHVGLEDKLGFYQARTSLCTKGPPRSIFQLDWVERLSSAFQRRMVMQDLRRTPLELNDVDVVIFDLIDERFNIHHVDGQLLTASKQFLDAGGQAALNSEIAFPTGSEEHYRSFQRGCEYMRDHLLTSNMEIYFHDARWAMTYRSNGSILEFDKPGVIAGSNRRLERMSEIFIEVMEPHRILKPSDSLVVGDEAHRWGKASFHYVPEYYDEIWSQITQSSA